MASPYRAFASASPSTFRNYDAPPVRRSPDPQFDDLLSDKELEASMDWPNWPNDPQGQMPLAQNNRQTIQAANQMRNIDLAGRRSQVRELLAEQQMRRWEAGRRRQDMMTHVAGVGSLAGVAAMRALPFLYRDSPDAGSATAEPQPAAAEESPFVSGYEETAPEAETSWDMWRRSPKFAGGNTPDERFDSLTQSLALPRHETWPADMQPIESSAEPLPVGKGGFPSGLLRHLLTPPPGAR